MDADPEVVAGDVVALFDGLLLRQLTAPEGRGSTQVEMQRVIEHLL